MQVHKLRLAVGLAHLAAIAATPVVVGIRRDGAAQALQQGVLAIPLALGGLAVLATLLLRRSRVTRWQLLLPAPLAIFGAWLPLRAAPADALLGGATAALCAGIVLSSIGAQRALFEETAPAFSARAALLVATALFGPAAIAWRGGAQGTGVVLAAAVTGVGLLAAAIAAARLEQALASRPEPAKRLTQDLLASHWFALLAVAALSSATALLALRARGDTGSGASWAIARDAARSSWSCSLPVLLSLFVAFGDRARWLGLRVQQAKQDSLLTALAVVLPASFALPLSLAAARPPAARPPAAQPSSVRAMIVAKPISAEPPPEAVAPPNEALPSAAVGALAPSAAASGADELADPPAEPAPTAAPAPELTAPSASAEAVVVAAADANEITRIEITRADGMTEADARSALTFRRKHLDDCQQQQPGQGSLSVRVHVDIDGSVRNVTPLSGDLLDTRMGRCALLALYRIGFAPRTRQTAKLELNLRFAPKP